MLRSLCKKTAAGLLVIALALGVSYVPAVSAVSPKILLTTNMVVNEMQTGDPFKLVDEQTEAGDPRQGPNSGGAVSSNWLPGWNNQTYPASAYIDLGQMYDLTDIYLFDANDNGQFVVSAGSPGNWTPLFTDNLTQLYKWVGHSVQTTTRYIRVTRMSPNAHMREIVLYGTPSGSDVTPPAPITDLAAGVVGPSSIVLDWTAPGDDGAEGTAASYDLRYSTTPITEQNWSNAEPATGLPAPEPAGDTQSYTLTGLSQNTLYYIAIRTSDEVPNQSGMSNPVQATTSAPGVSLKIPLDASMIVNETAIGDATLLVDEQILSGDPRSLPHPKPPVGQRPESYWNALYNSLYLPASAIIDLGTEYALTDIYLFDGTGMKTVTVSAGTPFAWTELFTDDLERYTEWKAHPVSITTRYVRLTVPDGGARVNEIVLYGSMVGTPPVPKTATPHVRPTMDQLIGINAFVDDPLSATQVAGFIREYHNWNWNEGDLGFLEGTGIRTSGYNVYPNNANKFNPAYAGGGGWNFDSYYSGLKAAGITVAPAIKDSVSWLTSYSFDKPVSFGEDPAQPASYAEHADFMFQYAARYGASVVADNKLKLAVGQPRSTGLNLLSYYENWNEQDKWWRGSNAYYTPYEYAAMSSADYDGHLGQMGDTFGVKNADPNAKLVMSGTAKPNLDYLKAIQFWSDVHRSGSLPFDVINIHDYSNDGADQTSGTIGKSPEEAKMLDKIKKFVDYRDIYSPGKEVWITEFGYDTNQQSPQKAPSIGGTSEFDVQADWIIRSYLAAAAAGVDKAAMYMLRDVHPTPDNPASRKFNTSGLTSSQELDYQKKPSWYFVYTLKNTLTGMRFDEELASDNASVKIYKFKSATSNAGAYVLWSPTSNNTAVNGYSLELQGTPALATQVSLVNGDIDGVSSALAISSGRVTVNVSERPIFVLVDNM